MRHYDLVVNGSFNDFKTALTRNDKHKLNRDAPIDCIWLQLNNTPDQIPPITLAAGWDQLDKVKFLFAIEADINARSSTQHHSALVSALLMARHQVVDYLLIKGADYDYAIEWCLTKITDSSYGFNARAKTGLNHLLNHAHMQQDNRIGASMDRLISNKKLTHEHVMAMLSMQKLPQIVYDKLKAANVLDHHKLITAGTLAEVKSALDHGLLAPNQMILILLPLFVDTSSPWNAKAKTALQFLFNQKHVNKDGFCFNLIDELVSDNTLTPALIKKILTSIALPSELADHLRLSIQFDALIHSFAKSWTCRCSRYNQSFGKNQRHGKSLYHLYASLP